MLQAGNAARRVIVTADDFGVSDGANRAVRELHECGVLTSAALTPTGEAFEDAAKIAAAMPSLEIGLHFGLTSGRPCAPPLDIPSLVTEDGSFFDRGQLIRRLVFRRVRAVDVATELWAQLHTVRAAGIELTFVNSDQHVHALPTVRDVVVERAAHDGIAVRVPEERIVVLRASGRGGPPLEALPRLGKKLVNRALGRRLAVRANKRGVVTNHAFLSAWGIFPTPRFDADALAALMTHAGEGLTEVMVHPGYADDVLARFWGDAGPVRDREIELGALRDPRVIEYLHGPSVQLTTFAAALGKRDR